MDQEVAYMAPVSPQRSTALALSGGVALGAYEAGVFAGLSEAGIRFDHLAGVSIGAINAVIIAGNPPEQRVARLRAFWDGLSNDPMPMLFAWGSVPPQGALREGYTAAGVMQTLLFGRPGLFHPRPLFQDDGRPGLYDLSPLRSRLERLVDFDHLNTAGPRLSIAATDVMSGLRVVFEAGRGVGIGPDHVLSSCAQMPVYAPVELEGRLLADGCYSGNTPVDLVLDAPEQVRELLCIVVDLFAPQGSHPRTLGAAAGRAVDLVFGNQTRARLDAAVREGQLQARLAALMSPPAEGSPASVSPTLSAQATQILLLSHRARIDEAGPAKGFDYTMATLTDRWDRGVAHAHAALRNIRTLSGDAWPVGVAVHDVIV